MITHHPHSSVSACQHLVTFKRLCGPHPFQFKQGLIVTIRLSFHCIGIDVISNFRGISCLFDMQCSQNDAHLVGTSSSRHASPDCPNTLHVCNTCCPGAAMLTTVQMNRSKWELQGILDLVVSGPLDAFCLVGSSGRHAARKKQQGPLRPSTRISPHRQISSRTADGILKVFSDYSLERDLTSSLYFAGPLENLANTV